MKQNKLFLPFVIVSILFAVALGIQSYFMVKLHNKVASNKSTVADTTTTKISPEPEHEFPVKLYPLPGEMDFCGEKVPLNDPEVYERMETEWIAAQNRVTANWLILKRSVRYFPIIEPILKKNGVPDDVKFLAVAESNLANVVSPSFAEGFWQFLKETGIGFGLEITGSIDERYDVSKATEAACKYLKAAYGMFGSWTAAAASYNMGQGGLSDEMELQRQEDYYKLRLNQETAKYLFRIITWKYIITNPQSVGINWNPEMGNQPPATRVVKINTSIADLVQWSIDNGTDYRMVRYLNPWIKSPKLDIRSGKTYDILLPAK